MDASNVRIAIAARDVIGTGGGTVALKTAAYFAERGYEVRLLTDEPSLECPNGVCHEAVLMPLAYRRYRGRNKLLFAFRKFVNLLAFSFFARKGLSRLERNGFISIDHNCEAFGADIVVAHNVFSAQSAADGRPWPKKILQRLNPVSLFRIARERHVFSSKRVSVVVAVSAATSTELLAIHECRPVFTITSGIDPQLYTPNEEKRSVVRKLHNVQDKFIIAFVGHEFERKRLDLAIKSLTYTSKNVILWVLGGRFSNIRSYQSLAIQQGVENRVTFWGTVEEVPDLLRSADLFLLPSDYETWGLVTIEAMACGLPVIMTRVGCAEYVVHDGLTGYICQSDAHDIGNKINRIMNDPVAYQSMQNAVRREALKHSWAAAGAAYLKVIAEIAGSRAA